RRTSSAPLPDFAILHLHRVTIPSAHAANLYLRPCAECKPVPAPQVATAYDVKVTGSIARVRVEQRFANPTDDWVEGLYVFPLAAGAAADELEMQAGERRIRGEIRPPPASQAGIPSRLATHRPLR